jgi:hypothetical protein
MGLGCADRLKCSSKGDFQIAWSRPSFGCQISILLARRNGRGSRLAARYAMPNVLVSRRNKCGLHNSPPRAGSKADPRPPQRRNPDNPRNKVCYNTDRHHSHRNRVRSPGRRWRCNSLHILLNQALRKPKRIAEPSISFVLSYIGYSNSRGALRASEDTRSQRQGSHVIPRPDRAWHRRPLRIRRCSRQLRDCRVVRNLPQSPRSF